MASSKPSRKWGREEVPPPLPTKTKEVPPPPLKEVKRLKLPQRKVARKPVVPLRAPKVDVQDACFSVKILCEAWQSLGKLAVHLGFQRPTDPLQTIVMDYAFKVNVLAGQLEREVPPVYDDNGSLDVSSSRSDSDGGAPSAATASALLICSAVNVMF
jgi:hypothetical protein